MPLKHRWRFFSKNTVFGHTPSFLGLKLCESYPEMPVVYKSQKLLQVVTMALAIFYRELVGLVVKGQSDSQNS